MNNHLLSFHNRFHTKRHIYRSLKAKLDAKRTISEKIADTMTAVFGSMTFIWINVLFFASWLSINTGLVASIIPIFDPFPYGLLTVVVSLEAIFLAITVLISQNRAAKIDDLREEVALQIDTLAEEEITKMIELQIMILKKQGVDVSNDPKIQEMLKTNDAESIERKLEKELL